MDGVVVVESRCRCRHGSVNRRPELETMERLFPDLRYRDLRPVEHTMTVPEDIPLRAGGGLGGSWCNAEDTVVFEVPQPDGGPEELAHWLKRVAAIRPEETEQHILGDRVYVRWWWD